MGICRARRHHHTVLVGGRARHRQRQLSGLWRAAADRRPRSDRSSQARSACYDTAGNVAEWVEDCWNDNYRGAPSNGSAWTAGQCRLRVLRGGAFDSQARYLRSSSRFRYDFDVRFFANGFRVLRELR